MLCRASVGSMRMKLPGAFQGSLCLSAAEIPKVADKGPREGGVFSKHWPGFGKDDIEVAFGWVRGPVGPKLLSTWNGAEVGGTLPSLGHIVQFAVHLRRNVSIQGSHWKFHQSWQKKCKAVKQPFVVSSPSCLQLADPKCNSWWLYDCMSLSFFFFFYGQHCWGCPHCGIQYTPKELTVSFFPSASPLSSWLYLDTVSVSFQYTCPSIRTPPQPPIFCFTISLYNVCTHCTCRNVSATMWFAKPGYSATVNALMVRYCKIKSVHSNLWIIFPSMLAHVFSCPPWIQLPRLSATALSISRVILKPLKGLWGREGLRAKLGDSVCEGWAFCVKDSEE